MPISPLHRALSKHDCNLNDIKLLLEQDASSINEHDVDGMVPLHRLLLNAEGSTDVVKLLLYYGADVHLVDKTEYSPLHIALWKRKVVEVVKILLEKGADVNKVNKWGHLPLCVALQYHNRLAVIKLLFDAGAHRSRCAIHGSPLLCYVFTSDVIKVDVLKLFLCARFNFNEVDNNGDTLLHGGLMYNKNFKISTIRFLLYLKGGDINVKNVCGESLLHAAVKNKYRQSMTIISFLLQQGVRVDTVSDNGDTALHSAVRRSLYGCRSVVIRTLLDNGSPVNMVNKLGRSALEIAVYEGCNLDVLKMLLLAGARTDLGKDIYGRSVMKQTLHDYYFKQSKRNANRLEEILKYSLNENSDFKVKGFICKNPHSKTILHFATVCIFELKAMEVENVGPNFTLREFLGVQMDTAEFKLKAKDYDFNQLLRILRKNKFPVYFDVILAKVKRSFMIDELKNMRIHTKISSFDSPYVGRKLILNYPSICSVAQFLSDRTLLNLILAFHNFGDCKASDYLKINVFE